MTIYEDTPFLYRFDKPRDRHYGPRQFSWIVQAYSSRSECTCAPYDPDGACVCGPWRTISDWQAHVTPARATGRQLKRLAKLGVKAVSPDLTRDAADELIERAESVLPPTPSQLKKARTLHLQILDSTSRGDLASAIDDAERSIEIMKLRSQGAVIHDTATWDEIEVEGERIEENIEAVEIVGRLRHKGMRLREGLALDELLELDSALSDLDAAILDVKRDVGIEIVPPAELTPELLTRLLNVIGELPGTFHMIRDIIDHLGENGAGPHVSEHAVKAVLPLVLDRMLQGTWSGDINDALWLARQTQLRA